MNSKNPEPQSKEKTRPKMGMLLLAVACALIVVIGILTPRQKPQPSAPSMTVTGSSSSGAGGFKPYEATAARKTGTKATAAEIVAHRLKLFSKKQRALVDRLAEHYKLAVPPEVKQFFDALDAGDWPEVQRLFKSLRFDKDNSTPQDEGIRKFWRPIVEAYGAAEQAQMWPPQQFLDYGNNILNSLAPGMVYVGGTDPGCFICTMLNATSDGEQHVTLTQNALADSSYLDYLRATEDRSLNIPTVADSQAAFDQYVQDATNRLAHDEQFPDQPKELLPGENVTITDGKVNVSGAVAVMGINNILMQDLIQMNPGVSFGMEESFPLHSTYAGAAPLGPIFALNSTGDGQSAITPDAATGVVNYWQNMAQSLEGTPDAANSSATMLSYAHDAAAQGNLLSNNNFPTQAEQAYQTALSMSPNCVDAAEGLAQVLAGQGQYDAANQALNNFVQNNPDKSQAIAAFRAAYIVGK